MTLQSLQSLQRKRQRFRFRFRLRSSDLQSDSDLDSIRNSCDVLFGLCKNLLPGLWPGSTSVQWRRRRRNWGKGLPLTRTHQQLVDLLPRVIPIHSFPLFLFCFFLKVRLFWHSSGLSSLYSFLSFQDYFLWGNPFRPQTVLWTLEHEEGGR